MHAMKQFFITLCAIHASSHPPTLTQTEEGETEPSWFHLLTQMKWDYITRNGRNSRFCLELGTYSKDAREKRFKTDPDSVNELTREQCVTTHTLRLIRIDQIHKNVEYKWLKKGVELHVFLGKSVRRRAGRGDLSAWLECLTVIGVLLVGCRSWQCL